MYSKSLAGLGGRVFAGGGWEVGVRVYWAQSSVSKVRAQGMDEVMVTTL